MRNVALASLDSSSSPTLDAEPETTETVRKRRKVKDALQDVFDWSKNPNATLKHIKVDLKELR